MTDDATLADFGVDDEGPETDSSEGADGDERDGSRDEGEREPESPLSALSTYAWGEHACARCGDATARVWREGDAFVCPDCKEW